MADDDEVEGEEILHYSSARTAEKDAHAQREADDGAKAEEEARSKRQAEERARAEEERVKWEAEEKARTEKEAREEEERLKREAEARFLKDMEPVFKTCAAINTALFDLLPAINLLRYTAVDGPHTSHRSLVEYTFERARSPAYENVPAFLRLVDECVTNSEDLNVERCSNPYLCPYSPEQVRRKFTVIGKLAYATWVQYGRLLDGHAAQTTDDDVVQCGRTKEEMRFFKEFDGGRRDFDWQSWLKQPGRWLPKKEYS